MLKGWELKLELELEWSWNWTCSGLGSSHFPAWSRSVVQLDTFPIQQVNDAILAASDGFCDGLVCTGDSLSRVGVIGRSEDRMQAICLADARVIHVEDGRAHHLQSAQGRSRNHVGVVDEREHVARVVPAQRLQWRPHRRRSKSEALQSLLPNIFSLVAHHEREQQRRPATEAVSRDNNRVVRKQLRRLRDGLNDPGKHLDRRVVDTFVTGAAPVGSGHLSRDEVHDGVSQGRGAPHCDADGGGEVIHEHGVPGHRRVVLRRAV
eukprot:scaffold7340_cov266-Pinguiococcus_pyrenoidosus.AAC.16